ncbi:MAG: restriction endonuclease [Armatimonadetes bacterium]|nr:restriction endonuclease [Armatimonadota bacterium]
MAVWMIRAGSHGENERKFLEEGRVYVTWDALDVDLSRMKERSELEAAMTERYADAKPKAILNWVGQVWPFAKDIAKGDLVVLPLKTQPAVAIGEITGPYQFHRDGPDPYFHSRTVKWIADSVPRSNFGQDLLYSFGAFLTICRIKRNNAAERLQEMRSRDWRPEPLVHAAGTITDGQAEEGASADLEQLAQDQIARVIASRFKGHQLTRLVDGILKAQGYTTWRSPAGSDGGADILAGAGPLGFGSPRLCVEVKSEDAPIDRSTVDKLIGAVSKFGADEGLFVAWGGFKSNVQKELASSFFRVRLWGQTELLEALFTHYEQLDEDLRAELPLKRIWTVAAQEGE